MFDGPECFLAGTKVLTRSGRKDIESIRVGDSVLARSERTAEVGYKRVKRLFRGHTNRVVNLRVRSVKKARTEQHSVGSSSGNSASGGDSEDSDRDDQLIRSTEGHPFYVKTRGWVVARELRVGDQLLSDLGEILIVSNLEVVVEEADHYNFEVEDWHTYFVTEDEHSAAVWVHNMCPTLLTSTDSLDDMVASSVRSAGGNSPKGALPGDFYSNIYRKVDGTELRNAADWVAPPGVVSSRTGTRVHPGHMNGHGMGAKVQAEILNNWQSVFTGRYRNTGRPVQIYFKDGMIVVTEFGSKSRVVTAYGGKFSSNGKLLDPTRWLEKNFDPQNYRFDRSRKFDHEWYWIHNRSKNR